MSTGKTDVCFVEMGALHTGKWYIHVYMVMTSLITITWRLASSNVSQVTPVYGDFTQLYWSTSMSYFHEWDLLICTVVNRTCKLNRLIRIYLYISGSFMCLIGHPLLNADQLLLQIRRLMLVKLCQVVELVFQTLIPTNKSRRCRNTILHPSIMFITFRVRAWYTLDRSPLPKMHTHNYSSLCMI